MDQFEKFLAKMKDSQEFAPDDRLSRLIAKYDERELTMDELDQISAASSEDYYLFDSDDEE